MLAFSPLFPRLYNTSEEARVLATRFITAQALFYASRYAFLHAAYFTLRSGGNTIITFLFDSVFIWVVSVPIAFFLSRYTDLYVVAIFALVQVGDWIKCVLGLSGEKRCLDAEIVARR